MRTDCEEFKLVTRRKKRVYHVRGNRDLSSFARPDSESDDKLSVNCETLNGRLLEAESELRSSQFGDSVLYYLEDSLNVLNVAGIPNILCYGLGHFSYNKSSKYQLALLLLLNKRYRSKVHIYDPVFSPVEITFLKQLRFNVIEGNEEGKRVIGDDVTLVYMPHCSIHLINNFLYANWCSKLTKCILLTNSLSMVVDNAKQTNRCASVDYVCRISPYVAEIMLRNTFTPEEAFNDLNIHIFPQKNIGAIPQSVWMERDAPCYLAMETDYLTAKETEGVVTKYCNYASHETPNVVSLLLHDSNVRAKSKAQLTGP